MSQHRFRNNCGSEEPAGFRGNVLLGVYYDSQNESPEESADS